MFWKRHKTKAERDEERLAKLEEELAALVAKNKELEKKVLPLSPSPSTVEGGK